MNRKVSLCFEFRVGGRGACVFVLFFLRQTATPSTGCFWHSSEASGAVELTIHFFFPLHTALTLPTHSVCFGTAQENVSSA